VKEKEEKKNSVNVRIRVAQDMESPTFVSKARTAFNSAAAKAERVLLDFKSDRGEVLFIPRHAFF